MVSIALQKPVVTCGSDEALYSTAFIRELLSISKYCEILLKSRNISQMMRLKIVRHLSSHIIRLAVFFNIHPSVVHPLDWGCRADMDNLFDAGRCFAIEGHNQAALLVAELEVETSGGRG